jgi:hypothetical protein
LRRGGRGRGAGGSHDVDASTGWSAYRRSATGRIEPRDEQEWELAIEARQEAERVFGGLPPGEARDLLLSITSYVLDRHG